MFEKYDPRKGRMIQLMNESGALTAESKDFKIMDEKEMIRAFTFMVQSRIGDEWALSLQRQGRLLTYPPNKGQEANSVGSLMALNKDDWFVQSYRELGAWLVRGIPLRLFYAYIYGTEEGQRLTKETYYTTPPSVPISSQLPHAVGIGYAEKYNKTKRVVITFFGDGGTSPGDYHESMNFAGVWKTPNIFYNQNNQYAISFSRNNQTASKTLAEKAFGYGFEGVQIDGNDVLAVYTVTQMAAEKARSGNGPTMIEGFTYRMGAHTTSDDPSKYRSKEEEEAWIPKDPLTRLETFLKKEKILSQEQIDQIREDAKKYAVKEFEAVEAMPKPTLEDGFKYMYKEMPEILQEQLEERAPFFQGAVQ